MATQPIAAPGINRRIILFCGAILFIAAFWLPAVAITPDDERPVQGWYCAWLTAYANFQSPPGAGYSPDSGYPSIPARVLDQAAWTVSGWISPLVAILLALSLGRVAPRTRWMIAIATPALMVAPFGVFYFAKYHPLAGHFVWMIGSLLIAGSEWRRRPVRAPEDSEPLTLKLG